MHDNNHNEPINPNLIFVPDVMESIGDALNMAVECKKRLLVSQARCIYLEILDIQPNHAEANYCLGILEMESDNFEAALVRLEAAVIANPQNEVAWLGYIELLMLCQSANVVADAIELGMAHGLKSESVQALTASYIDKLELRKEQSKKYKTTTTKVDRPQVNQLAEYWRSINQHNETYLTQVAGPINLNRISIGRRTYGGLKIVTFGNELEGLRIGSFVSIANEVTFILGGNHPYRGFSTFPFLVKYFDEYAESTTKGEIVIKDDVWIGQGTTILSGVTVGQGAVIAAGSLISSDVDPYCIVGGNPARIIKYRFPQSVINRLSELNFSKISDDAIMQNRDVLYEAITMDNIEHIIGRLTA